MPQPDHLRRIRFWLALFIIGLVLSGVTAFPLETEVDSLLSLLNHASIRPFAQSIHLLPWTERVNEGLQVTNAHYPFLAYGTDWLAFAHLVIAVALFGPYIDPIRNKMGDHLWPDRVRWCNPTRLDRGRLPWHSNSMATY